MAVKFLYYFVFLFIGIAVFLVYQKPYNIEQSKSNKNKPNIEVVDMTNYSLTQQGINHVVKATKVLRFSSYDEFYNIDAVRKAKDNLLEKMEADKGTLVKDDLKFSGNVHYKNSNNVKFSSQQVAYNLKTKVFKSDTNFILEDNRSITYGTSMVYKTIEGKIYANNIKSKIEVKEK